jgi:hypothetical protein
MIDFGGDQIAPSPGLDDRGYAKLIYCGNTAGLTYSSTGERYDQPVRTLFGTPGQFDGAIGKAHNADLGTKIFVRRGHAENISAADMGIDTLTRKRIHIVGEGDETERPTFTFTAAAATWLLDTDSIIIENCNINLEPGAGAINVAAPITVSGNGCGFRKVKFRGGTDANNKVTVGITWTGKDGFMEDCTYNGATAATATTHLRLTAADRFRALRLRIDAATTAVGVGVVQFLTTASLNQDWRECFFRNNLAASTQAFGSFAANTGAMHYCNAGILAGSTATAIDHSAGSMNYYNCRISLALGAVDAAMT